MNSQTMRALAKQLEDAAAALRVAADAQDGVAATIEGNDEVLRERLSSWNAGVRANRMFAALGLETVGDLIEKTPRQLLDVHDFGITNLIAIRERLSQVGLVLRDNG